MKKMMIAAAAVALASFANASQAMWGNFFGVYEDINGDTFAGGSALLYVLAGESSTVSFTADAWNLNGATLVANAGYSADDEGWGSLDFVELGSSVSNDGSQYFQLLILDQAGVSSIDGYEGNYVSFVALGSQEVVEPSGPTFGVDVTMYNDIAAADWQTAGVPEPTSGLLLLLGMAGLALKRKQA